MRKKKCLEIYEKYSFFPIPYQNYLCKVLKIKVVRPESVALWPRQYVKLKKSIY